MSIVDGIIELLKGRIKDVSFARAYTSDLASRLLDGGIVTTVGVGSEKVDQDSSEKKLELCIYLPHEENIVRAEEIFTEICDVLLDKYSQIKSVSRGEVKADKITQSLMIPCTIVLSAGAGGDELSVTIDEESHAITGVRTSISTTSKTLTSVGEDFPFAVMNERTLYSVELEGIDAASLEEKKGFSAQIGSSIYHNCAWKSISQSEREACFVSYEKSSAEESVENKRGDESE